MKYIFTISTLLLLALFSQSQTLELGTDYKSYFKNHKQGLFEGTVNGVVSILTTDNDTLLLDFQTGSAKLAIEHDPDEMYDVSIKNFVGFTTSGKTQITYLAYGISNEFHVYLKGERYVAGSTDGAADMVISGLKYNYFYENGTEFLSLYFDKEVKFNLEKNKKISFKVLRGSTLVYSIKTEGAP
jgi:hypothetical protein